MVLWCSDFVRKVDVLDVVAVMSWGLSNEDPASRMVISDNKQLISSVTAFINEGINSYKLFHIALCSTYMWTMRFFRIKVSLAFASVFQLCETCTTHGNCSTSQACLGPTGQKKCLECQCNNTSECELSDDGKSVRCNCANSGGYTGAVCDCPPQPVCQGQDFIPVDNGRGLADFQEPVPREITLTK
ncbi:uncharacterized protein LOC128557376 [Mercenaria mercenaria]|uniref:uncharacterized protein LOC128557376 n=1 Tax=Mercenaria mercenaria TaxID=6596 RepID=UPI00234F64C4|nr:uncharacterized protein LOC128557376 [Mercenaria mercenaria]